MSKLFCNKKRFTNGIVGVGFALLAASSGSFAGVTLQTGEKDLQLSVLGAGWVESGQFVKYFNADVELDHGWISRTFLDFTLNALYKERLRIALGVEGRMWFNLPKQRGTGQATYVHRQNSTFIISDANATYSLGDRSSPLVSFTAGLFPYKYNAQVRNLGEYLFRTGTYPAYIINTFDLPFARLTGFKISSDLFGALHQDLIYSIETSIPPFFDGTVSYLAGCNLLDILDIGAGASFARLVSVDGRTTTQKAEPNNQYVTAKGDTGYYSFRGIKVMGKLCFDPKQLLTLTGVISEGLFGREDCKMYCEAVVLGLENFPKNDSVNPMTGTSSPGKNSWGYDTLKHKMPVMIGVNVPTFNVLNVLAVEFEWYGCTYPNSYKNQLGPGPKKSYAVPDFPSRPSVNYESDNWKWTVYLKKTFFNDHLGVVVQFARDHIRNETLIDESFDYEEALSKPDQWWWMSKLSWHF